MATDGTQDVELEDEGDDQGDEGEDTSSEDGDTADQGDKQKKRKRTDEEELEHLEGRAKRLRKKLGKDKSDTEKKPKPADAAKPTEFDYGQLAYLTAKGIEHEDDLKLVQEVMKDTGRDLKAVLASKHFQGELKAQQEARATQEATPSGSRRSNSTSRDKVEYWLAKDELPPADQPELRRKVVNAKIAKRRSASQFTDHPVAGRK